MYAGRIGNWNQDQGDSLFSGNRWGRTRGVTEGGSLEKKKKKNTRKLNGVAMETNNRLTEYYCNIDINF